MFHLNLEAHANEGCRGKENFQFLKIWHLPNKSLIVFYTKSLKRQMLKNYLTSHLFLTTSIANLLKFDLSTP